MTREEAILWLNEELRTWENECQSKHPIKEALYEACKALERELNTWSLDDAREDFMYDVYNILDFLPTNDEANQIIDSFDRVAKGIKQEPRWIPVSERLPDKLTNVNIAFDDCPNEYDVAYLRTTVNETYRKNGALNEWVSWMGEATYADYEVSAWMEIKPYKAESEG